jgi:hypothetical protein
MSRERWARIEGIFHDAVSLEPEHRASFLESACGRDFDLRREMESLLAHDENRQVERAIAEALKEYRTDTEVDSKLRDLLAPVFKGDRVPGDPSLAGTITQGVAGLALLPGMMIGEYEVIALLGAGGMGEVYRARDNRLRRDVAIKCCPPSCRTIRGGCRGSNRRRERRPP